MQGPEQLLLTGRIHPISLEIRPLQLENMQARDLGLRDGQIIQATLEMRGDSLKLLINGKLLDVPPGLRFRAGDSVWLKAQARSGGWQLRPMDARAAASTAAAEQVETAAPGAAKAPNPFGANPPAIHLNTSRLQALLLRPPITPELMALFEPKTAAALLKTVGDAELVALFRHLQLSMRGLSPADVQKSVIASGLWLEAMLGSGKAGGAGGVGNASTDVKTLLRRLIRALGERDSPDQARLARAVDDIESAQVESVRAQSRGDLVFPMVIPFSDANPVELEFSHSGRGRKPPSAQVFTVNMHTVHATLGELWLQLTLSSATEVDLMMWALKRETAAVARKKMEALRKALTDAGLSLGTFKVFNAARPLAAASAAPPGSMLDIQT